jgi:ATP-dependent DNA helicase RecQ
MQIKVITLRFDAVREAFDDGPLQEFARDKEVLSADNHFFIKNETPYLAVVVNFKTAAVAVSAPAGATAKTGKKAKDESWRELLRDEDMPLYNTLRKWRSERSKREGIPPYIICNNKELAEVVRARPTTPGALGRVEGFGKAKLERYGEDLLALLAHAPQPAAEPALTPETLPAEEGETNGHGQ